MTENVVLEILSAFIHNRKPCLNQDTQEDKLFYSFYIQGILPILAYMDKKWDIIKDANIKKELVDCYYQAIAVNLNKAICLKTSRKSSAKIKSPTCLLRGGMCALFTLFLSFALSEILIFL